MNNKYLLAVSGGPDSIFLLDKYKSKNIIVCHVNYNRRVSSIRDMNIVKDFCDKHNIILHIKNISKNHNYKHNFQAEARVIRYDFFKKIYDQEKCTMLLTAHHKNDFLETCLIQERKKVEPNYFGIQKEKHIFGMNVFRPFIDVFTKQEIINYLKENDIVYGVDESNESDTYLRNRIRKKIETWNEQKFNENVEKFNKINDFLSKKNKQIDVLFEQWKDEKFSCHFFKKITLYKKQLIFKFIHKYFNDIKLSKNKILSIVDFIEGDQNNGKYKLKNDVFITKQKNIIII